MKKTVCSPSFSLAKNIQTNLRWSPTFEDDRSPMDQFRIILRLVIPQLESYLVPRLEICVLSLPSYALERHFVFALPPTYRLRPRRSCGGTSTPVWRPSLSSHVDADSGVFCGFCLCFESKGWLKCGRCGNYCSKQCLVEARKGGDQCKKFLLAYCSIFWPRDLDYYFGTLDWTRGLSG